jgi:glycosyltransferase involved in cell wall biosynthesis
VVALGGSGELLTKLGGAGIRTISVPSLKRDIALLKEVRSFFDIYRIISVERPDVLHVNSSKAGGLGALAGRLAGTKNIVYTAHGWAFNEDRGAISRFIVGFFHWLTILLSHTTVAVSNAVKEQMTWPLTKRKMMVLYNGKKPVSHLSKDDARNEIVALVPKLKDHLTGFWTLSIGELHPIKGHDVAIRAIGELNTGGCTIKHIIIGDGELKEKLQRQIEANDLNDQVFLAGYIADAAKLLKAFDLFILPSRSEALCYVAIEAAQAGIPVVGSNVGGIPEIVTHSKDGLLVPPDNVNALKNASRALYEDFEKRTAYSSSILESSKRFSFEQMLEATEALYNRETMQ